jgi:3-oxoadipate enol-lactonase
MIGLWLAAHAPERVDRLAACCTSAYVGPDVARAYAERAVLVRDRGLEPIADAVVERWFSPGFRDREPDTVARYAAELRATPAEGYAGCCDALVSMDLRPELVAVRAPTLVVVGAADSALPPEHGAAIAAGVPDARLVTVPGAAHLAPAEAPEAVGNALVHHLAG